MKELIKVNYENDRITTSARTLWEGLNEPWGQFTKWFDNYKGYGFTENKDYKDASIKILTSHGREHDAQDYEITINMAKQLAMLQKTPEGKIYREYFIKIEEEFQDQLKLKNMKAELLLAIYDGGANAIEASKKLSEIEMKPLLLNSPMRATDELKLKEIAQLLGFFTTRKKVPYAQFIGTVIRQLDNTNNRIYRHTFSEVYDREHPDEIIYVKQDKIPEILDYINNLSFTTENGIRKYTIKNKHFNIVKK